MTNKGHTDPHNDGTEQYNRHVDGRISVDGKIEVYLPPDFSKEETAKEKKTRSDYRIANFVVSLFTLIAVVVYAGLTAYQAFLTRKLVKVSQDTYSASERPYVGSAGVGVEYESFDKAGKTNGSRNTYFEEATQLEVQASIKNYGPVPGNNFESDWALFVDDKRFMQFTKLPEFGRIIFPGQIVGLSGGLANTTYRGLISGKIKASIEVRASYDGPNGHYAYCNLSQFLMPLGQFVDLGKCTHQW